MSEQNVENVAETLAEYERLAIKTGAKVQIMPPEFTADGKTWGTLWLADEPPAAARARVYRDDVETRVEATWRESLPLETSLTADGHRWCDIWQRKPMQRLGSYVLRAAISRAFRDAIGDRHEPEDDVPRIAEPAAAAPRDWAAEAAACETNEELAVLRATARLARAFTPNAAGLALKAVFDTRSDELAKELAAAAWLPDAPELSPEELGEHHRFFPEDAHPPVSARDRAFGASPRMPQDHKQSQKSRPRRKGKGRR